MAATAVRAALRAWTVVLGQRVYVTADGDERREHVHVRVCVRTRCLIARSAHTTRARGSGVRNGTALASWVAHSVMLEAQGDVDAHGRGQRAMAGVCPTIPPQ